MLNTHLVAHLLCHFVTLPRASSFKRSAASKKRQNVSKLMEETDILLMVQKSAGLRLRLVVYLPFITGFYTSKVVVWDFWTINSSIWKSMVGWWSFPLRWPMFRWYVSFLGCPWKPWYKIPEKCWEGEQNYIIRMLNVGCFFEDEKTNAFIISCILATSWYLIIQQYNENSSNLTIDL